MRKKKREFRPNVVLASAIYSGLSALVNLAYNRKSDQTATQYDQIRELWETARKTRRRKKQIGSYDFSAIQNVESALRMLYLKILWKTTRRYGNRETKRVYSWREGTIGPLNALLNFAGATLRDTVVPRYPFPDPDIYEVREYPDGQKKVIPKSVAKRMPAGDTVRIYDRAGYRGNSEYPRVLLSHPTLPALDFGDMIRAHLAELCRQCFIYNVPQGEAQRYIRLLIHRFIPFLDWVYTQGESGRKNFHPGADVELQRIVREIQTLFGVESGREEGISRKIDRLPPDISVNLLIEKIEPILASSSEEVVRNKSTTILNHVEDGIVTDVEVARFVEDITKKSAREGTDWHRVLLSGLVHPRSLSEAIFAGDRLCQTPSGLQYLAEVPVKGESGDGSIDLALFARILKRLGEYIWTPVMILEIKTKIGFNFNLYGKRPRTKKPRVFVPVLNAWKRFLTEREWASTKGSVPPQDHLSQLDAYENVLLSEYNALLGGVLQQNHLWKGVVTLDVSQDFSSTKKAFDQLLRELADRLVNGEFNGQWKALTIEEDSSKERNPRVAITMTPAIGDISVLKSIEPLGSIDLEDPFKERIKDDVLFTQYISVPSPTSSGKTAAWLAKNWHLLNHLVESEKASPSNFIWLDLLGDYPTKQLIEMRFGLDALKQKRKITTYEYGPLRKTLSKIHFISLREVTNRFLFDDDAEGIMQIQDILKDSDKDTRKIVVVDGWSVLEKMLPTTNKKNLTALERVLLQVLEQSVREVIWVDDGADHPQVNATYQRPCVHPLFYTSPRKRVVDEILWNLPTAPRKTGWTSPQYDDCRVIIQDVATKHPPWISVIHVPILRGMARKFRATTIKSPVKATEYLGELNQQQNMYGRDFRGAAIQVRSEIIDEESLASVKAQALTLIPSLRRKEDGRSSGQTYGNWTATYTPVDSGVVQPSLTSRLHLDVTQPPPVPNRTSNKSDKIESDMTYVEADHITRGWIHKTSTEEDDEDKPVVTSRRPPHAYSRRRREVDTLKTRQQEVRRIATAAEYLARKAPHYDSLFREIVSICSHASDAAVSEEFLLSILQQVRTTILRKNEPRQVWNLLLATRLHSTDLLDTENQRVLRQAQKNNPELLELYGMNLFLAIVSVVDRVLKRVDSSICETLWSAVTRWQFYQMGFEKEEDDNFAQRYDFQTIHANLVWRAQQMKDTTSLSKPTFPVQFGQLLVRDKGDSGQSWLLFPSFKSTMFGALLEEQLGAYLRQSWYRGVIDPERIKEVAEEALTRDGWDEYSIALVDVKTQRVLFVKTKGDDGEEWTLTGAFEYGTPPKEQSQPVRWIRLSQPLPETLLALHGFLLESPPNGVRTLCDNVLRKACEWGGVIRDVSCVLTIDAEKQTYKIELREGRKTIAQKVTASTDDVISFLRYPLKKGEYFSTADGILLKWDPLRDIDYDDVVVKGPDGTTEYFSMTVIKPLIHRSTFFPESYSLPASCKELLQTQQGKDVTIQVLVNEQILSFGSKKYLKVQFDELTTSSLVRFEKEKLGIFDVALLCECEQLIDVDTGRRHNVSVNAEDLVPLKIVHLLSEYPRLESTILSHIDDLQQAEVEGYEEGMEQEQEYIEPDYEEGMEPEYEEGLEDEPDYDVE
jgi:hypothetical protein